MKNSEDIINKISDKLPFSKKTIREVVNKTFSEVKERMGKKDKVMLRGFMKFVCATDKKTKEYSMDNYKQLNTKEK
jgi:nucleoid DNA-binding protein